ncbi:reverse transcriptase domain-containing protein [Tanacetum coccineum]
MHTRASNSELVEPLSEPERTLNHRLRRRNRSFPFERINERPEQPRVIYLPILDINYFHHFLNIHENYNAMDDEPMRAADRVVALIPGSAITIPESINEFAIKGNHLTLVKGNQFDGRIKTDPHKHIVTLRKFPVLCYVHYRAKIRAVKVALSGRENGIRCLAMEYLNVLYDDLAMAAPIISISSNTSEESVGSSTSRVVLFGMIPTIIPVDVSTLVPATIPSVIHNSATKIPIILPRAPEAGVIVVASPAGVLDLITYSSTDSDSSKDPPAPEHAPSAPATSPFLHSSDSSETSKDSADSGSHERPPPLDSHGATVAWWRSRVALRSSSPSSPTHVLPTTAIASHASCRIVPTPPGVPFPARILANRRRFDSSSSSPPRKRRRTSSCLSSSKGSSPDLSTSLSERSSHSVTTHSPSSSTRPSRKRCRSPTTLVTLATPTPGALLHESLEVASEEDIDSDVMADIEVDIAAEATSADEIKLRLRVFKPEIPTDSLVPTSGEESREDFEIGLDVVIQELYDHMEEIPAQRIANIKKEQRAREIRALADERDGSHATMIITRSGMTLEGIEEMITRRVAEALAEQEANRTIGPIVESESKNRDDNENEKGGGRRNRCGGRRNGGNGNGGRNGNNGNNNNGNGDQGDNTGGAEIVARECTYKEFLNRQPFNFRGTEGAIGLARWFKKMDLVFHISNCPPKYQVKYASCTLQNSTLTWWNAYKRTIRIEAAYALTWNELMKLMTEVYCPRNEIKKMESELWNLIVKGNDLTTYT